MLRAFGYVVVVMAVVVGLFSVYSYRHFNENLTILDVTSQLGSDRPDKVAVEGPREPINVLVMGSEGRGLRKRVADSCDQIVSLPVLGRVESLNISTAAAAILYEILQSRRRG